MTRVSSARQQAGYALAGYAPEGLSCLAFRLTRNTRRASGPGSAVARDERKRNPGRLCRVDEAFPDFASLNPGYGPDILTPDSRGAHAPTLKALLAEHFSRQTTPVDA
jgi:hypothetical protein